MKNLSKLAVGLLAMSISIALSGFVLTYLWSWFVVPVFEVPTLGMVESVGLVILVSYIKSGKRDESADLDKFWVQLLDKMSYTVISAVFFLFIGWLIQLL